MYVCIKYMQTLEWLFRWDIVVSHCPVLADTIYGMDPIRGKNREQDTSTTSFVSWIVANWVRTIFPVLQVQKLQCDVTGHAHYIGTSRPGDGRFELNIPTDFDIGFESFRIAKIPIAGVSNRLARFWRLGIERQWYRYSCCFFAKKLLDTIWN